ncbi:MAG: tRNA (adenosine(37)-N6)-threonylcarbamoyltransferase complex transferase subunit TsaD [Clostridia bacterium]|nr:tRNA (adenosine(37)-N6)-threonylcarbamoyltransferase complex transferase subunit TsaD [Clostridia bacterium]
MLILGIESSCDDTSAAVVSRNGDGRLSVLSNVVASQIETHRLYGGVVPEIAGRAHAENISGTVSEALRIAGITPSELDAVAVTTHPGLIGALLVGVNFAKAFAYANRLPIISVNHIEAHTAASYLLENPPKPPFLSLVVSGGHTSFYRVDDYTSYEEIGGTRDDAAGEAFDKVGRVIGLPYPSGAAMDALAFEGDRRYEEKLKAEREAEALRTADEKPKKALRRKKKTQLKRYAVLPSPAMKDGLSFSFSGLKSAALNFINSKTQSGEEIDRELLASDYTAAVTEGIVSKVPEAVADSGCTGIVLAGGVAANRHLRAALSDYCAKHGLSLYLPPVSLCGDNAAMVAAQGAYEYLRGSFADTYLGASANDSGL